jgi:ATP-dependent DNA helicase PIF1
MLDTTLLFSKAKQCLKKAISKVSKFHNNLSEKANRCLHCIPEDKATSVDDISAAFDGVAVHCASGEPYYWEQCYHLHSNQHTIVMDESGKAHIFKPVIPAVTSTTSESVHTLNAVGDRKTAGVKFWECNPYMCNITQDSIDGTVELLEQITNSSTARASSFYLELDSCRNQINSNKLGHPTNCSCKNDCSSLLRPARILSSHFTHLRTIVRRVYELRQLCICIEAVRQSITSGSYRKLKRAVKNLNNIISAASTNKASNFSAENDESEVSRAVVEETSIMSVYGKELRKVTEIRDSYNTKACDICEQVRSDLTTLATYVNKPNFSTKKTEEIIEMLYVNKTQYENVDTFLQNMWICKYCADKLKGNKDIARSAFNCLRVEPVPPCIADLNLFEKVLIKSTITCLTVVRLGQITNNKRPHNELTSALKGRIAHLPIDLTANAKFLPENLLNIDSLVLLVGGQPTKNNRIWTSVVDLRKVHVALQWLKENNELYKDIPSYSLPDLHQIVQKRLQNTDNTGVTDTNEGTTLLKRLNEASRSYLYENFTTQPISGDFPADSLIDYQMSKVNAPNMNIFDSLIDVTAFPELFPTGKFGFRDANRNVKIGTSDFIKSRLLNKNRRFRLSMNYLFHCFQLQEVSNMCHSVGHMLRTVTGNSLSAKQLHTRLQNKDGELQTKMFSLMANLRGTKEYFNKVGMELKWMLRAIGPPTLFITCSCAEYYSEPFLNYIRTVNSSVPGVEKMTPMGPVSISLHFTKKWEAIFNNLIKSKSNPLFGEITDHFWRIEYQARGAPHVHCLLWIKDAPILGINSQQEVIDYINTVTTCSLPDPSTSPTLFQLVSKFQTHKCNKYCLKTYQKNKKFFKKCSFGFPRPVKTATQLNDVIDCLAVNKNRQPRKRLYYLQRTNNEQKINDYNAALLMANQANIDVQFIGHAGSRLPYYVMDYITKHERSEQDTLWEDIFQSTKSLGANAMNFLMKSVKSRQVGAVEAADRLLGHKLYSKSRQTRFADLQTADKVKRVLKTADDISKLLEADPDSEDIYQPHWVLDVYPDRPHSLEQCSLYELLAWFEREKCTKNSPKDLQLKTLPFFLRRRTHLPYIVTHQIVNPNQSDESKEKYYYYLLKLFKPWRSESEILLPQCNYYETFTALTDTLTDMVLYHEKFVSRSKQDDEFEKAIRERADELRAKENVNTDVESEEGATNGCVVDQVHTAMQDVVESHKTSIKQQHKEEVESAYNSLNVDQKCIVDSVVSHVCDGDEPIRLLVSGQGGTGKSRIIDVLNRLVSMKMSTNSLPVVIAAPTGLSAHNIGGTTIHRLLQLPVEHLKPADYCRLSQDQLNTVRATLGQVRLVIVDEISMVSSLTLLYMHLRLTEIMSNDDYFGSVSVVFFGDFLQLRPVKGNQPFVPVTPLELKKRIGAIGSADIWKSLSYDELTINMRQKTDKDYANLLSSLRNGVLDNHQLTLLASRRIADGRRATLAEICQRYSDLHEAGQKPIMLMPRTALCDEINNAMLTQLNSTIHILTAIDTLDSAVEKKILTKVEKAYQKVADDTTQTAGLVRHLQLSTGARVMLKRNMDVDAGLVNGSVGTVVGFEMKNNEASGDVVGVMVKFEKIDCPVSIRRESFSFEVLRSVYYTRKQFPLMLAFAITVHKAQGLSLECAIVDAGSSTFGPGMTYVALSRITTLAGLHLIDFDRSKVKCDRKAIEEYNRLRSQFRPDLDEIKLFVASQKRAEKEEKVKRACHTKQHITSASPDCRTSNQSMQRTPKKKSQTKKQHNSPAAVTREKQTNLFQHSSSSSVSDEFRKTLCQKFGLLYCGEELHSAEAVEQQTCRKMQTAISLQTNRKCSVKIYKAAADGNCLYRALSLGLTGSQTQHDIIRSLIVDHLVTVQQDMSHIYAVGSPYSRHLQAMRQPGCWGTEREIIAAANLFGLSIFCFSRYGRKGLRLQQFTSHFATDANCYSPCFHQSIFLVNSTGNHYNLAEVTAEGSHEE